MAKQVFQTIISVTAKLLLNECICSSLYKELFRCFLPHLTSKASPIRVTEFLVQVGLVVCSVDCGSASLGAFFIFVF